jgi:hypothetical protein
MKKQKFAKQQLLIPRFYNFYWPLQSLKKLFFASFCLLYTFPGVKNFLTQRTKNLSFSLLFTNISFSALHLINLLRGSSIFYNTFQIVMAVLIGLFYSTRYYLTYNLYEIVVLHMMNNLFAMFIPIDLDSKTLNPWFYFSSKKKKFHNSSFLHNYCLFSFVPFGCENNSSTTTIGRRRKRKSELNFFNFFEF